MGALLLLLIAIYLLLGIGRTHVPVAETWLVRVPFSIYLGWITVATIANITSVLENAGWNGWGLYPATWAVIMMVVAAVIAGLVSLTRGDVPYVAVILWAFAGIAVKHNTVLSIVVTAWVAGILVALTLLIGVPLARARMRDQALVSAAHSAHDRW